MTILLTILASLLVFGAVIAVHEFGHFAAATGTLQRPNFRASR